MFSVFSRLSNSRPGRAGFRALVFIVLFVMILGGLQSGPTSTTVPIHVAVMLERVSGDQEQGTEANPTFSDSLDARRGAELCAAQINKNWEETGVAFQLIPDFYYDEGNNIDVATAKVQEMLADDRAVAVVGHAFSNISVAMGEYYADAKIPAITASAVNDEITLENEWYFRALPNSSTQAQQMAQYIFKVLEERQVTVIKLQGDPFSEEYAASFQRNFKGLGGLVYAEYPFADPRGNILTDEMRDIVNRIQLANGTFASSADPVDNPGVIVFVMRAREAGLFIKEMRDRNFKNTLFGPSALANQNFVSTLRTISTNRNPNFYSNGVYALAPVVYDTADSIGQKFLKDFRQLHGDNPGMKAATNCDALKLIAQAITTSGISGDSASLPNDRIKLRDALAEINSPAKAVDGVTGTLYFDDNRNPVKPIDVSLYQDGERISAPYQFVEIDADTAERLRAQNQSVVDFENRHFSITNVVYVGVDINGVGDLDIQAGTYVLDFYIWFRGRKQIDPITLEPKDFNPEDFEFLAAADSIEFGDPVVKTESDDGETFYLAYQVKSTFKVKDESSLKAYPFDSQLLGFEIKSKTQNSQGLLLALDTIGMRGITADEFLKRLQKQNVTQSLGGAWTLGDEAKISQEESRNDSTLGIPGVTQGGTSIPYSRFVIEFEVRRNGITYSLKNFLPMIFLVGLALMAFFSDAKDYGKMYDVVTSVILTAAFFQLGLTDSLPNIGYTTALDWMFYLVYFLCILQIVIILQIKRYVEEGKEAMAARIVYISRFVYVILVFLGGFIIYLSNWRG